jgi:nicotinamide-nucleotide amidase
LGALIFLLKGNRMFSPEISALSRKVISAYTQENLKIVTAESCTGGLVASALTSIPGSSEVFERGFTTYTYAAKIEVLGVESLALEQFGAVSPEVAAQMARGALDFSHADVAVSLTGIAGPDGGSENKPVGLVFIGLATRHGSVMHYKCNFTGDRDAVRTQAIAEALKLLMTLVGSDAEAELHLTASQV